MNAKRDYGLNQYKKQHTGILEFFTLNLPVSIQESIKSPNIIIEGFVNAGILDAESESMSSFQGIINTMTIPMNEEDKHDVIKKFNSFKII